MKRIPTFLLLSICTLLSHAQITFLTTDAPAAGWVNAQKKDTATGAINWGNRGANQVYDFSRFHNDGSDTTFYLAPTTAQTTAIPGSTLAVTGDRSTFFFAKNASTLFDYIGAQTIYSGTTLYSTFSPVDTTYKYPTVYGQHFAGTYGFQTTVSGSAVGQSSIYEVRLTNTTTYTDSIDGWGIVKTPVGTYNCLREHRIEHSSTLLEYKLFSFSSWANVPTSSSLPANPVVSTTNIYNYITKETHGTAITFTYDANNNPLTASWSTTLPVPIANFGYTAGAAGVIAFHDSSTNSPSSYSWTFGDGSAASTTQDPTHTYAADGTYYVCLTVTNASGSNTKCDSVHVTNIAIPAVAPLAVNDTASVVQPGSVSVNVVANDINYNAGDTLCISSVSSSPAGWATVQGCTNIVFHALDSNYTGPDTVYYVVCDIEHPTLCDTAALIVNVKPEPRAPVTSFSIQNVGCTGRTFVSHSTGADSLSWSFTEMGTSGTFDTVILNAALVPIAENTAPYAGNTYEVCLSAKNNVGTTTLCDTLTFACTGISEIAASDLRIYPNPASDEIKIDLSKLDQKSMAGMSAIEVYDLLGNRLITTAANTITTINVNGLSNGVYVISSSDKAGIRRALGKFEIVR